MPASLGLPIEIQLDVFEYAIIAAKPAGSRAWNNSAQWRGLLEAKQRGGCTGRRRGKSFRTNALPLLLTSRQVHAEAVKSLSRIPIVYELDLYPPSAPHRDGWFYHWRYVPAVATTVQEVVIHVPGLIFQGHSQDNARNAFTRSLYHRAPIVQLLSRNGREIKRIVIDLECELLAWSGSGGDWEDLKKCLVKEFDGICRHLPDQKSLKVPVFWRLGEATSAEEMLRVSLNGELLKEARI
jgi:hypothetical protein